MKERLKIREIVLELPEGVSCEIDNYNLKISGPNGEMQRNFLNPRVKLEKKDNSVVIYVSSKKHTKKDKSILKTIASHINNMIEGVVHNYEAELKICSGHFPMSVSNENNTLVVKNFLGEKIPRKADLYPDVKVEINGDIIKITGINKESVGQTAANIERSTKIKNRDKRIFQDGIWMTKKPTLIK